MCTNTCSTARCSRGAHAQARGSCHTAMRKRKAEVHNTSSRTGHATTRTEGARIFCRFISLFMNYTPRGHTVDTQHYAAMRETERYRKRTRPAPRNKRTM